MSCWLLSCNSVLSRLSSPPSWRLLARLLLLLALSISLSRAELIYQYEGQEERIPLTQLWYEGHWKEVRKSRFCHTCSNSRSLIPSQGFQNCNQTPPIPSFLPFPPFNTPITIPQLPPINGTITWNRSGDVRGKIVVSPNLPPHEASIREFQAKGAAAVLFYRIGSYPPGFSMYVVDGSNRGDIWLPVMEVTSAKNKHFPKLSEGAFVQCIPTENLHKKANDSKFQLVMNLVQSLWEMAIVFVAVYRLFQFYFVAHFPLFSIAPLCCTFEGVAAALRLAYTVVDPFYTYRMLDFSTSVVLVTISWPFSESAGILLTFFCTYFSIVKMPPQIGLISLNNRRDSQPTADHPLNNALAFGTNAPLCRGRNYLQIQRQSSTFHFRIQMGRHWLRHPPLLHRNRSRRHQSRLPSKLNPHLHLLHTCLPHRDHISCLLPVGCHRHCTENWKSRQRDRPQNDHPHRCQLHWVRNLHRGHHLLCHILPASLGTNYDPQLHLPWIERRWNHASSRSQACTPRTQTVISSNSPFVQNCFRGSRISSLDKKYTYNSSPSHLPLFLHPTNSKLLCIAFLRRTTVFGR